MGIHIDQQNRKGVTLGINNNNDNNNNHHHPHHPTKLVGGLEHFLRFHINWECHFIPIVTHSLHHFSEGSTTNQMLFLTIINHTITI